MGAASTSVSTVVVVLSNCVMMMSVYMLFASSSHQAQQPTGASSTTNLPDRGSFLRVGGGPERQAAKLQIQQQQHVDQLASRLRELESLAVSLQGVAQSFGAAATTAQQPQAPQPLVQAAVAAPATAVNCASSSSTSKPRNAVLGLAKGIDLQNLYQFVRSLRESAPDVDILIWTDDSPPSHTAVYSTFRATVIKYSLSDFPPHVAKYHPSSYRWILMRDYLRSLATPYDNIMFTDVRDTVFQADPFSRMPEPGFYAFLEAKPTTVRQCGWNSGWVKDCFGARVLNEIGGNVISCSGTSMGSWPHAMQYVEKMGKEIESNKCERNGVDQGMHNVFVHRKELDGLHVVTNEDGWIATVQSMKTIDRNIFGQVLNTKGEIVAVVHQWDRSPELTKFYARQFSLVPESHLHRK